MTQAAPQAAERAEATPAGGYLPGDFLPPFVAPALHNPQFHLHAVAGMRLLLLFTGDAAPEHRMQLLAVLRRLSGSMAERQVRLLLVEPEVPAGPAVAGEERPSDCTCLGDPGGRIARSYGLARSGTAAGCRPAAFLLRENLQLVRLLDGADADGFTAGLEAALNLLPPPEGYRRLGPHPPVLQVPSVLPPALCRDLIACYEREGGSPSGFMRDVGGRTVGMHDPGMKRRRDCTIADPALLGALRALLLRRVVPEIRKAFCFEASRVERYIVARYDAAERGFFRAHRDNTSRGTAHRRFAMTVNLNSEGFEGGELLFPEYGRTLHKPATGTALVFSCALLHEARPVTAGLRYAFLPFFYDDAAAEVRRRNLDALAAPETAVAAQG